MTIDFLTNLVGRDELVSRPDHPLLLRGPDALVGVENSLCAVFEPHSLEERNPAHLATRLIASRLALPRSARTLLVLSRRQESRFAAIATQFSLTTNRSDQSLRLFLRSHDFGQTRPLELESFVAGQKRFDAAMEVTRFAFFLNRRSNESIRAGKPFRETRVSRRLSLKGLHYDPRNRVVVQGIETSLLTAESKNNLIRQVNSTLSGNVLESFDLVEGLPQEKSTYRHSAVASAGEKLLDLRSKAVYAAALTGTAVIFGSKAEVIEETLSHFSERFKSFGAEGA